MTKPYYTLICLLMATNSIAQTTFQKKYVGPGNLHDDYGTSCFYTKQGTYFITGSVTSFGIPKRAFFSEVDSNGITLINETYNGLDLYRDSIASSNKCAIQIKEKYSNYYDYVIAGERQASNGLSDFYITKVDNVNHVLWEKNLGGDSIDIANSVIATFDNEYILSGQTNSFGGGLYDMYMCSIDENGTLLWARTVGGSGNDYALSSMQTKDSDLVFVGYTNSFGEGNNDVYIVKLDKYGDIIWSKVLGGIGNDIGTSIIEGNDGEYILCGYSNSFGTGKYDAYLAAIDTSGILKWTKTISSSDDLCLNSIIRTTDKGYAMAGYKTNASNSQTDAFVIKVDNNINIEWAESFGGPSVDYVSAITQGKDNEYLVVGSYADSSIGDKHVYIAKIESNGRICNGTNVAVHTNTGGNLNTPLSVSSSGGKIYNVYSEITSTYNYYKDICSELLPLKLLFFTAYPTGKVNELKWRTEQEFNFNHFDIERSNNGKDFMVIGRQIARTKSPTQTDYSFVDEKPLNGANYYRLQMVDNDGKYEYSIIRRIVNKENTFDLTMFPNPAKNILTLNFTSNKPENIFIEVFDLNGRILKRQGMIIQMGSTMQKLNISSLKGGSYIIKVKARDQQLLLKFVKL